MRFVVATRRTGLNIRSGPSTNHPIVGSLSKGSSVEGVESRDGWQRLKVGGWVSEEYLEPASSSGETTQSSGDTGGGNGLVLDHPKKPNSKYWKFLAGFDTGEAHLKPAHRRWLHRIAIPRVRDARQWIFLRGLASNLGNEQYNLQLSRRRARSVRDYLVSHRVDPKRITGAKGIGEEWARGSDSDNSPRWRAVEALITNNVVHSSSIFIGGDSPLSRRFFIKYMGGGGGGLGGAGEVNLFIIRTPNNYWQRYFYAGAGAGLGVKPGSFGTALPRGKGWVSFSTSTQRTADSFEGPSAVGSASVQMGSFGVGRFEITIPGVGDVAIPTGPGLGAGMSFTGGALTAAGPVEHNTLWKYQAPPGPIKR